MKESPIIFNTEMVQAILNGKKTQTRRVLKPTPEVTDNGIMKGIIYKNEWYLQPISGYQDLSLIGSCPFGAIGDLLYVRETFAPALGEFAYKADYSNNVLNEKRNKGLWKPSIHMPKSVARIWLKITDIRVERLQEISEEDAKNEGVLSEVDINMKKKYYYFYPCNDLRDDSYLDKAVTSFYSLWRSINGQKSWDANPWVWVITFERIEK